MTLNVVDKYADTVVALGRRAPRKGNVGDADGDRGGDVRQERVQLAVTAEGFGGLQDGIEPPARCPVDEEPHQDALIEQAGPGLEARSRQKEEGEEVVVNAQVQRRRDDADEEKSHEEAVDG